MQSDRQPDACFPRKGVHRAGVSEPRGNAKGGLLGIEQQACGSAACAPRDYRLAAVSPGLARRGGSILSGR